MTPEEAIYARINELTDVIAIAGDRIYLDVLPQRATYPAVLVQLVSEPTSYHLRGGQRDRARVQVDAYETEANGGDPYATVMALADAINGDDAGSGLSGWRGDVGSPRFRVQFVQRIIRVREYEPGELQLLRQRQDYMVFFKVE